MSPFISRGRGREGREGDLLLAALNQSFQERGDHRHVAEGDVSKAEYALDGAQPAILMASVTYVDDESFVLPSGVATEPADALPPHEAHPLPAHRTPFPKPLM